MLLADLQAVAANQPSERDVARLRHEAETGPLPALASATMRALELTDRMCWESLTGGDASGFARQAVICAELWEFAICAGLLEEG